ncbi:autotransporter assembly complex protein TamB [Candidatus Enterovibrio escicola]
MRLLVKRLTITVILFLVLSIVGVGVLLLTSAGMKFAIWGAKKALPELTIKNQKGTLFNGFTLMGLSYKSPSFSLTGKRFSLDINSKCLRTLVLCIDGITADGLVVTVGENKRFTEGISRSKPIMNISTPVQVFISGVVLNDINLNIFGNKVHWDSLETSAQMRGNTFILKSTQWQGINFQPASLDGKETKNLNTTAYAKQAYILPYVNIPLNVVIERFELKDAELFFPEKQIIHHFLLQGHGSGNEVTLEQVILDVTQGNVSLNGKVTLKGEYPLTLNATTKIFMAPFGGHTLQLEAKGDLKKLVLNAKLQGVLVATLSGDIDVLDPDLPFSFLLISKNLQWPINLSAEYLLSSTVLRAEGSLDNYRATFNTIISGDSIPDITLKTNLSGDLLHVSLSDLELDLLDGDIAGMAEASWEDTVKWQTELKINNIQLGLKWPNVEGQLSGRLKHHAYLTPRGGWQIEVPELDIEGIIRGKKFSLVGQIDATDEKGKGDIKVETEGLLLLHGPNKLVVTGRIDKELDLKLFIDFPSLAASLPQAGGSIKGDLSLSGTLETPKAVMNINANTLRWQTLVSINTLSISGSYTLLPIVGGELIVKMSGVRTGSVDLQELSLRVFGDETDQIISLTVRGELVGGDVVIRGSLDHDKSWKGTLSSSKIMTPVGSWILVNVVPLGFDANTHNIYIGTFCLMQNQSRVCLDQPMSISDSGKAMVSIINLNIDVIQSYLPVMMMIKGRLDANAKVSWTSNSLPTVTVSVSLSKGSVVRQLAQPLTVGWNKINLNAVFDNEKLDADLLIDLTDNGSASLNAVITNISSPDPILNSSFSLNRLDLDVLAPMLGDNTKLAGELNGDVVLRGALDSPSANGNITLTRLKLQSFSVPLEVHEGKITLELVGHRGQINGDIKTLDGDLILSGKANWTKLDSWLASLNMKGEKLMVRVSPNLSLELTPNVTLKVTSTQVDVTGNVSVPWGRILVKSLPESAVKVSSDVVLLNNELQPVIQDKFSPNTVNVTINVNIGNDVKLEAFGLTTMLVGNINLVSNHKGSSVNGAINLENGTYRSFGQDLLIKKGYIQFTGPLKEPDFQVEAIRNPNTMESGVEVGIRVTGFADETEVQVFSDPVMPQANILSYLVRGRNLDSESDGHMMTSLLISFGLSKSGKLVGQFGEIFGVQDLTLDTSGRGGGEKVEVSGYILPGLQVKYGVGIFTKLLEFTVRYRLLKNLYIEAVSGKDIGMDLLYQFSIK